MVRPDQIDTWPIESVLSSLRNVSASLADVARRKSQTGWLRGQIRSIDETHATRRHLGSSGPVGVYLVPSSR